MDLVPSVALKNAAPEDIANSPLPHTKYLLLHAIPELKAVVLAKKIKTRVRARLEELKQH